MEETNEELPNFSTGIDLLGPDPKNNKSKAVKNSQVTRFANLSEDQLGDTWVHLALIFSIFRVNFKLLIQISVNLINVLAQTKV